MTKKLNPTEEQIKALVGLEEVLSCLDQHAGNDSDIGRACLKAYADFDKLRTRDVEAWNAENPTERIHRCEKASAPYHTDFDGPCDVYVDGWTLCELHTQLAIEAEDKANAERAEYFAAKRRGEDV